MEQLSDATFWIALGKIVWVNILLSGDNAVVIALAARGLPESQRNKAVLFGSAAAIVLRVVLTLFAVELLHYPYLKLIGAALLFWIGVQLLVPEGDHEGGVKTASNLWTAVRTILIADLVMSLDNVIAVAAAAESGPPAARNLLLVIGLGLSIPLIIFGSQVLMKVMERYPVIIVLGAALLGFVAGEMLVHDQSVEGFFIGLGGATTTIVEVAGAVGVVLIGKWLAARRNAATAAHAAAQPRAAVAATPAGLQRVLLAVDRFAMRTLCYRIDQRSLSFSSRADKVAGRSMELDPQAIFDFLYFHAIPAPRTIFSNVLRLPAGHSLIVDQRGATVTRHWTPHFDERRYRDFNEARSQLRTLIGKAVRDSSVGEKKAGAFLSS